MSLLESSSVCNVKGHIPQFMCIEYPANVVNIDNMMATLGGIDQISQVRKQFLSFYSQN